MFSLLNESASFFESYGLILILLAALIIMFIFSSFKNRDLTKQRMEFLNTLKIGDKVKTYSGLYGIVETITDTTDGKVVLIKSGNGKKVSYVEIDLNAVYGLDTKSALTENENNEKSALDVEVYTEDIPAEVKRPRGRPHKVLTVEELAAKATKVKRPRGRPRKVDTITKE
ncbi:MAG: preprotein translocase subunit YajC [Clostridia bacterium]|jgi:preprotein translocase YajC subunit|nr:preprotein translocase subunit YajC [Clostridia bacterium]MDD4275464.1 preprotein translocase subunit YajC [Clostridia bacterium]